MNFLYFQDGHFKGRNSQNRLGNYFEDMLLKLDEIISIAKENKCDCLIDGGDMFESDKPSYSVLDAVADKIESSKIHMYSLFGNHTMTCGHIENSQASGLAHLIKRSKYFHLLQDLCVVDGESDINEASLIGIDYEYGIEDKLKDKGIKFKNNDDWKIAFVHALVTPKKFFDSVAHVTPNEIKTNADLVLVSHYHQPYQKQVKNTMFLDIGCLGRDNIDEANIKPSVLLVDTDKRKYDIIPLKSAKPGHEIFDLSKYEELKGNKKNIKEFLNSLKDINFQTLDLGQQITKLGKEQNIEQKTIDYILNKLSEVKDD